jgi:hypothetical protein
MADGMTTFQGSNTSVIVQSKGKHTPFMLNVHHATHQTSLVVQMLF